MIALSCCLVGVVDVAHEEVSEAFFSVLTYCTVVTIECNYCVAWLHSVLLEPICDTSTTLPVVTGVVEDCIIHCGFNESVKRDERNLSCIESFLASCCGIIESHHDDAGCISVSNDCITLVNLLFT